MEIAINNDITATDPSILNSEQHIQYSDSLNNFLKSWDKDYADSLKDIPMFDTSLTSKWSDAQRKFFVKILYHARGHFHDILWYMGNFAPNKAAKDIILGNVVDEFNKNGLSHENLYFIFAKAVGVDLNDEALEETTYLPFLKEFNKGYLRWLVAHDWESRLSCFASLERLDKVDYTNSKAIAKSFDLKDKALVFFNVHIQSNHFNPIYSRLLPIWNDASDKIKEAFYFVLVHQSKMWKDLSDAVVNFS